jgi:hypothetical protein
MKNADWRRKGPPVARPAKTAWRGRPFGSDLAGGRPLGVDVGQLGRELSAAQPAGLVDVLVDAGELIEAAGDLEVAGQPFLVVVLRSASSWRR